MASALNPCIVVPTLSNPTKTHISHSKPSISLSPTSKANIINSFSLTSPPHPFSHSSSLLLELCSDSIELSQILPHIIKTSLQNEVFIQTKLLSLFSKFGQTQQAQIIFHQSENKTEELWHSMLKTLAKDSTSTQAFELFCEMKRSSVQPSVYNFTYLLKNCGDRFELSRGREIHGHMISSGFSSNVFAMTALVNMYAKCRKVAEARQLFDRMPERDLVAWNALLAGYAQNGFAQEALKLVSLMREKGERPDSITLVTILPACAHLELLKLGKSIHGFSIRSGFNYMVNVGTAIVDMYTKCGCIDFARKVFDRMTMRNVVSWNAMLNGYVQSGASEEALELFWKMQEEGIRVSDVTIMGALHACANLEDLEQGKLVHEQLIRAGLGSDVSVLNSLIAMYSKCKRVDLAYEIFSYLPKREKTLCSWNAMISGYTQAGCINEALGLFSEMRRENVEPDSYTLVSIIPAYAHLSGLRQGKWIHGYAIRSCLDGNVFVATALVDMYGKCGGIETARMLFNTMDEHHVTTWNAMIDGYGTHGHGEATHSLFEEMLRSPIKPNDVTFLCVLSACSHSGLANEGLRYFAMMQNDYGIEPNMDHYGSMVDLLGRSGMLYEAWDFIEKMPIKAGISVYGALLGACKIHQNVELGEMAAKKLFELEPPEGGYYVLLANIYASASRWDDVARVRNMMEKKGLQKTPGCSLIELRNEVHSFYSGCTKHPQAEKIYATLRTLKMEMKALGYVPDTSSILDVEDDVKEQLLNSHSEKLAIAFGLINTRPGTTIQIRKNLRVCADCHTATKFISKITERDIIVRDMHRFHHFKDGDCSCGDYW
ncbi:pentatricopeptide repeat-containing protein At1g11290, chloroplastic [Amborella trichopoda]|uniref:pentatricopeptide repeat-containing protein At1g11290, chloroplastic n=1 Tax=Amborella trichopoda TaxID=13333 RepID=UPI0005D3DF10|nr:pentatricopeptide repeat-containing protein At1g11290, chloroplastic [Amborella trichopoda]|eukprot:XP_011624337.1 pentatricopeptide repeat-containing protein At1g11290, chloroplastic [Amborella trichopoda]